MPRTSFYAVAVGRVTGVYTTWDECSKHVKGYPNAKYRKCNTRDEALAYIAEHEAPPTLDAFFRTTTKRKAATNPTTSPKRPAQATTSSPRKPRAITVYTDGACVHNGKPHAKAGIGVWFGTDDPRNVSERVPATYKQTNNVAELLAIWVAYERLLPAWLADPTARFVVATDSRYALRCATTYGAKCALAGWSPDVPNVALVRQLYEAVSAEPRLTLKHVFAHTGGKSKDAIGNDHADRLAVQAIGGTDKRAASKRTYLRVPFAEKDAAKALGAKWDSRRKKWYTHAGDTYALALVERFGCA